MPHRAVFPVSLLLDGRPCLVVGGRRTAKLRVDGLLEVGAKVTIIAPDVLDEFDELPVVIHRREFQAGDTSGFLLVVSATGDPRVDVVVHADARKEGALMNAVDNPESCDLYLPAVLRQGPITVAISTGGASPAVASWARNRIGEALGDQIGRLTEIVSRIRSDLRAGGMSSEGLPWYELIDELAAALAAGTDDEQVSGIVIRWRASLGDAADGTERSGRAGNAPTDD